jgi:hypothetical protein
MDLSIRFARAGSLVCFWSAALLLPAAAHADHPDSGDKKEQKQDSKDAGAAAPHVDARHADAGVAKRDLGKLRQEAKDAEKKWIAANNYSIPLAKLKVESTRNAHRIARLRRIRAVAEAANDQASVQRVDALLSKEKDRHEQWAKKNGQKAVPAASASGKRAASAAPVASAAKGGAK